MHPTLYVSNAASANDLIARSSSVMYTQCPLSPFLTNLIAATRFLRSPASSVVLRELESTKRSRSTLSKRSGNGKVTCHRLARRRAPLKPEPQNFSCLSISSITDSLTLTRKLRSNHQSTRRPAKDMFFQCLKLLVSTMQVKLLGDKSPLLLTTGQEGLVVPGKNFSFETKPAIYSPVT